MADFVADLLRSIWIRVLSSVVIVFALVGTWTAPKLQERFFPVIEPRTSIITSHWIDAEGWTNIRVTFKKNYNCRSIGAAAEWFYTDKDGQTGVVPWEAAVNSHSPSGIVVSPALRIQIPDEAKSFYARVLYDCGLPWQVFATIGPFSFPLL